MSTVCTLEAIFAKKGDALLLHYGPWEESKLILIDGGPRGIYRKYLKPRLQELREEFSLEPDESLPIRMAMVSHIDDDHIAGVNDLFAELLEAAERRRPRPYEIETLWHNSFDDILGNSNPQALSRMAASAASNDPLGFALPPMSEESRAVVASTAQGRFLRDAAKKLGVSVNAPFDGLICAPAGKPVQLGHGLSFTVIGPDRGRVDAYQKQWDKDLEKILKKERESARAAAFEDDSPFNLASVCVLARMKGRSMLLTGDARGDYVLEGLEKARLLKKTRPLHVDLMKVPHHGSDRNVDDGFFARITADHYVISGDGEHGNPEAETLNMIQRARGDDPYTVHFTFTADAHQRERNRKRKQALQRVDAWVKACPSSCDVVFQDPSHGSHSIFVDLMDPLY